MNVDRIVLEIKKGNLVIAPSDTVYGILADALNTASVMKVFDAKRRGFNNPLLILVSSFDMLTEYTQNLSLLELELISKYFPGRLTILLEKNEKISDLVTANSKYVGVRIPDNKDLIKIIDMVGHPLISTSANVTSKEVITSVSMIEKEMLDKISYVEDGGEIRSMSSTIIKVEDNKIKFLREGKLASKIRKDYNIV